MRDPAEALPKEIFQLVISNDVKGIGFFRRVSKKWNALLNNDELKNIFKNPFIKQYLEVLITWLNAKENLAHQKYKEVEVLLKDTLKLLKDYGNTPLAVIKLKNFILAKVMEFEQIWHDEMSHKKATVQTDSDKAIIAFLMNCLESLGAKNTNFKDIVNLTREFTPDFQVKGYASELALGDEMQRSAALLLNLVELRIQSYNNAVKNHDQQTIDRLLGSLNSVEVVKACYLRVYAINKEFAAESYSSNVKPDSKFEITVEDFANKEFRENMRLELKNSPEFLENLEKTDWELPVELNLSEQSIARLSSS